MWILYFLLIKNHQDVVFEKCVIYTQHGCGRNANFFLWKHEKKPNKVKNDKLVVFIQVTNYVGSNPSIQVRDFLCPSVGTFRFPGLTLDWDNLRISQHWNLLIRKKNYLDHSNICATRPTFITYPWLREHKDEDENKVPGSRPIYLSESSLSYQETFYWPDDAVFCYVSLSVWSRRDVLPNWTPSYSSSFPFSNLKPDYTQWPWS